MRLSKSDWMARAANHEARLASVLDAHRERKDARVKHPIVDFLFEYYRFRPSKLGAWSPGLGVVLEEGKDAYAGQRHFREVSGGVEAHTEELTNDRFASTEWILRLLQETQRRPPSFGCNGLHEWAMVYGTEKPRHLATPLRLSAAEIRSVVDSQNLVCSHFDAFRFFTPEARPLNRTVLEAGSVPVTEQPGCLHANMDIYRWAMKRYPWVDSDLIADSFLLALEIRDVDMRASPYDLSSWNREPIRIEEADGRAEYRSLQGEFHRRGLPIRARLIDSYRRILADRASPDQATATAAAS